MILVLSKQLMAADSLKFEKYLRENTHHCTELHRRPVLSPDHVMLVESTLDDNLKMAFDDNLCDKR